MYHANFGTFGKERKDKDEDRKRDTLQSFKKRKWDNKNDEGENGKMPLQKNSKALKIDFGKLEESLSSIPQAENQRLEEENTELIGLK